MKVNTCVGVMFSDMGRWLVTMMVGALLVGSVGQISAQDDAPAEEMTDEEAEAQFLAAIEEFGWKRDGQGELGSQAEIAIPDGYRFTGREGTASLMELYGNPPSSSRLGLIGPENLDWFVVFNYEEMGYVKDDEKDDLDADEMLEAFKETQIMSNEQRQQAGVSKLYIDGWAKEPFYNEETNNLEWAIRLRDEEGNISVNYRTKLLGRHGVMDSILVCGPEQLAGLLPTYQGLIGDYSYKSGKSYAEYKKGDRIAEVGLKGLMIGGGAFVAAKLGLFGLLLNVLKKGWILVVAAVVGLKSWISKLFSRNKNQYTVDP